MARALVLNASYEPLSVVTTRRAVVLVLNGKAHLLESVGDVWHAERMEVPVPSVVKLNRYVRVPYGRPSPLTRNAVFARDRHRCQYCGEHAESIDHVVPRSRGGTHSWDNVVASCRRCNLRKGDRLPEEMGYRLSRRPAEPHRFGWVYARVGTAIDPVWEEYLLAHSA